MFRRDDPVLDLPIALNDQVELRRLLATLPSECFRADDALGWTYQFWQAQRKEEVNKSGKKIGANELAPVTQLFTEDYMVEFLLHNTLGAWWAGKLGPIKASSEDEARAYATLPSRDGVAAVLWTYLRLVQDETTETWLPAAGTFDGWPTRAAHIRLLDPCMGSGHFLVFALPLLVRLRMEEESLGPKAAVVAVLKDNIHGLELDERCTQIAAFNVALTGWKLAGYQNLPQLHIACSGLAPSATEAEWLALAGVDDRLRRGMMQLYDLFKEAPVLGSLINPFDQDGSLLAAEFHELNPLLKIALAGDGKQTPHEDTLEFAVVAQGIARAAELLVGQFTLVVTNVPYLLRRKQADTLQSFCAEHYRDGNSDLATCFVQRCLVFCAEGRGSTGLVTPQNWLFLNSYKRLRIRLLRDVTWDACVRLGAHACDAIGGEVVNVALLNLTKLLPSFEHSIMGLDVSAISNAGEKGLAMVAGSVSHVGQAAQLENPDARIALESKNAHPLLETLSQSFNGQRTGDSPRFIQHFFECSSIGGGWVPFGSTVDSSIEHGGNDSILLWEGGCGQLAAFQALQAAEAYASGGWKQGWQAWGKTGIRVSQMGSLPVTIHIGCHFDVNTAAIVPSDPMNLPAIWSFCCSDEFQVEVRKIDQALKVTNASLVKILFDLTHWQKIAAERYPNGLPMPYSSDPTQWLFSGHPKGSDQSLHVAVARLLGYCWPRQTGSSFLDCPALGADGLESFADSNGIVCLPPVNHKQPAANRLRQLLAVSIGNFDERALIAAAGLKASKSKVLEDWLRDEFFEQHAKLFRDRPFIWHLWDGLSDGFNALVNYHKLDHATLQKLTYSYLGNWIQQQDEDAKVDKPGAAARLGAAQSLQKKLAAILEGEAPLDIFVRWKPIKDQAQGWHPDLNDGIRQNIRPFLLAGDVGKRGAGLFRTIPLALKDKDRGNEPNRPKIDYPWFWCEDTPGTDPVGGKEFVGTRWNNVHLTLEKKRKSRA